MWLLMLNSDDNIKPTPVTLLFPIGDDDQYFW